MKYNEQIFIQTTIEFNDLVRDILFNYKGKKSYDINSFSSYLMGKTKNIKKTNSKSHEI